MTLSTIAYKYKVLRALKTNESIKSRLNHLIPTLPEGVITVVLAHCILFFKLKFINNLAIMETLPLGQMVFSEIDLL